VTTPKPSGEAPDILKTAMANAGDLNTATILREMAQTFEKNFKTYGTTWITVGKTMEALFPNGKEIKTADDFMIFHLLEWVVGKLVRFSHSGMTHIDSIHDAGVYCAMVEMILRQREEAKAHG